MSLKIFSMAGALCIFSAIGLAAPQAQHGEADILKRLDDAKTSKDRQDVADELQVADFLSEATIRAYVNDESKDGRKRLKALRALHKSQSEESRARDLEKYLSKKTGDSFRAGVAMEMGRIRRPEMRKTLRAVLDDPSESSQVQLSAAWALAANGDEYGQRRALWAVLEADPWRDFGIQALVILKAKEVFPEIEKCLIGQKRDIVLNSCRLAKLRIEMASQDQSAQLLSLDSALREEKYFEVRAWAGRRLAEDGSKEAGKILAAVARNNKLPGALAALDGLKIGASKGKWTGAEIQEWLAK